MFAGATLGWRFEAAFGVVVVELRVRAGLVGIALVLALPAQPERSGVESGVHETKRRRDGGWSPDGSAGVQIYDDVTEKMFGHASPMREDEAPEGLMVHSAGQGEQGYYVYDIWESQEAFERFMEEKLGPALGEIMGGPPPEGGAPQYFPIDVLVIPH